MLGDAAVMTPEQCKKQSERLRVVDEAIANQREFEVSLDPADRGGRNGDMSRRVILTIEGQRKAADKVRLDSDVSRARIGKAWTKTFKISADTIVERLGGLGLEVLDDDGDGADPSEPREAASYRGPGADGAHGVFAELAWGHAGPDFIIYDCGTQKVSRCDRLETPTGLIFPPSICAGIVTPGSPIPGSVLVPSECVPVGADDDELRGDVATFICRYVELPEDTCQLAIEYVFLSSRISQMD